MQRSHSRIFHFFSQNQIWDMNFGWWPPQLEVFPPSESQTPQPQVTPEVCNDSSRLFGYMIWPTWMVVAANRQIHVEPELFEVLKMVLLYEFGTAKHNIAATAWPLMQVKTPASFPPTKASVNKQAQGCSDLGLLAARDLWSYLTIAMSSDAI